MPEDDGINLPSGQFYSDDSSRCPKCGNVDYEDPAALFEGCRPCPPVVSVCCSECGHEFNVELEYSYKILSPALKNQGSDITCRAPTTES